MHTATTPLALQVRLMEDEPSYCSYGEAYEMNCARFGREADMPITTFKKRLAGEGGAAAAVAAAGGSQQDQVGGSAQQGPS